MIHPGNCGMLVGMDYDCETTRRLTTLATAVELWKRLPRRVKLSASFGSALTLSLCIFKSLAGFDVHRAWMFGAGLAAIALATVCVLDDEIRKAYFRWLRVFAIGFLAVLFVAATLVQFTQNVLHLW